MVYFKKENSNKKGYPHYLTGKQCLELPFKYNSLHGFVLRQMQIATSMTLIGIFTQLH